MVLHIGFLQSRNGLSVIQSGFITPIVVRVTMPTTNSVDAINLTRLFLGQLHKDYGSLRDHCVDHQSRKHCDENGAECETEVTLASAYIAVRMLYKELESLPAA